MGERRHSWRAGGPEYYAAGAAFSTNLYQHHESRDVLDSTMPRLPRLLLPPPSNNPFYFARLRRRVKCFAMELQTPSSRTAPSGLRTTAEIFDRNS